jgi:phosphoribosylaminoimidazole (AIR) synthetase
MNRFFLLILSIISLSLHAQPAYEKDVLLSRLSFTESVPEELLATRSIVLYDQGITQKDLEETQQAFQQTGIDAIAYFVTDFMLAGADPEKAFAQYLTSRNVSFLIFITKDNQQYSLSPLPDSITPVIL